MKKIIVVFIIILFIIAGLAITKNTITRLIIVRTLQHLTGLNLSMQSVKLKLLKTQIDITNLRIYNPEGYPDKIMADLPVIYVAYNLAALIKGKVNLPELGLHLKEFNIIKNDKGKLNISSIKVVREQRDKASEKKGVKTPPIHIASLKLKIGRVVYKDYSQGTPPQIKEFNINLDETYQDITDLPTLVNIIILKALRKTAIDRLVDFDLSIITDYLPPGLKETARLVTESAAEVKKAAKEGVKEAARTIKKTTEVLTEALQLPKTEKEKN